MHFQDNRESQRQVDWRFDCRRDALESGTSDGGGQCSRVCFLGIELFLGNPGVSIDAFICFRFLEMTRPGERDADLTPFSALVEPLRKSLFLFVASSASPVGRDQAADALGVTRSVAAFHLDKLADAGVVEIEYRRPPGRTGRGAGRPAKLYRSVTEELLFSVPERHYDVAATVLTLAVADAESRSIPISDALRRTARRFGRAMGATSVETCESTAQNSLERVAGVLTRYGYEPHAEPSGLTLANCPYRALAKEHPEVVCQMNLRLLKGLLKGAERTDLVARPDVTAGQCCVRIVQR